LQIWELQLLYAMPQTERFEKSLGTLGNDAGFSELRSKINTTLFANINQQTAESSALIYVKKHTSLKLKYTFSKLLETNVASMWSRGSFQE